MIKNLITKKDISYLSKMDTLTPNELCLIQQQNWSEQMLQISCRNSFLSQFRSNEKALYFFQQNDNGGSAIQGIRKMKAATGTVSGWPDVTLWKIGKEKKFIFVEFKKIGVTKLGEKQEEIVKKLKEHGQEVYLCNNTVYFDKVICQKFKDL